MCVCVCVCVCVCACVYSAALICSFFARFGQDTAANAVVLPAVAPVAKNLVGLGAVPDVVAAQLFSTAGKVARAVNPMKLA